MSFEVVLTCEHAGNRVPAAYKSLFRGAGAVLESHRGWDPGALTLAKTFKRRLSAPLYYCTVTRLLVEPNRSLGHRNLFSEFTATLDQATRQAILRQHYYPHRRRVEAWIAQQVRAGVTVLHLALHTFTPHLHGQTRHADVALLYDPQRELEKVICDQWRSALKHLRPDLRVRRNYPYRGKADGLTSYLRCRFAAEQYLGIELELNQLWPAKGTAQWRRLQADLASAFAAARVNCSTK